MNIEQNSQKSTVASKRKYWYKTDVYACVLCGKEKVRRKRVLNEKDKGTHWYDDACSEHFF